MCIRKLLKCETRQEYDAMLAAKMKIWDSAYSAYFLMNIHPKMNRNGLWTAKAIGWQGGSDRANFVANQSEGINSLNRLQYKQHFLCWLQ